MLKHLFGSEPKKESTAISLDPRPGIAAPPPNILQQWLDKDVEVIDLGVVRRDEVIQPTTWHVQG